jgi:ATP-dependent DNA helicase RecQ
MPNLPFAELDSCLIISGNATSHVKTYNHHKIESFGKGSEKDKKFWTAVLRQMLIAQLISKEIENYGLIKLTDLGHQYLEKPYSFKLTKDHDYDEIDEENSAKNQLGSGAVDPVLFNMLKDLRKKISKNLNIPPFVIFQDPSLEDMAIQYPVSMEEMQLIVGVGAGKAQKYGKGFVELIAKYVEENEIERPQDMVVRSVVNKSGNKVYIIQSIDRKMPLPDIAAAKGMEMMDFIAELEAIVYSGTKIDIDYYLKESMDEDVVDEIFEYFNEAENDTIPEALEELGEEYYSEEEIRLVRIKYISEVGN